jgi:ABC-type nickel/cobalt efflux system permease component RcnA
MMKSSGWRLLSLLSVLVLVPLGAYARDLDAREQNAEPVARTKPVVDQPIAKKHATHNAHRSHDHDAHHKHATHKPEHG